MTRAATVVAAALGAGMLACGSSDRGAPDLTAAGGRVEAEWQGADTVNMAIGAIGTARWCGSGRWLELAGVRGDTGVMIGLFPAESLVTGDYPIALPARSDSERPRPAATLGIRWFTPGVVAGYQGYEGRVEVTAVAVAEGGRTVSGRFEARAVPVEGEGSLTAAGSFSAVPVVPDSGCAPPGE